MGRLPSSSARNHLARGMRGTDGNHGAQRLEEFGLSQTSGPGLSCSFGFIYFWGAAIPGSSKNEAPRGRMVRGRASSTEIVSAASAGAQGVPRV